MSTRLRVPDIEQLGSVQKLNDIRDPYGFSEQNDALFVEAMQENFLWHMERNRFYRDLVQSRQFNIDELQSLEDLDKLPFIFANFFKTHELKSVEDDDVILHLTSSGTTGQKSQMFFDEWTIKSAQRMVEWIWEDNNWISDQKVNYLLFTYEPEEGSKLGTAYTDNFLCSFAPVNKVHYALKFMGKDKGHKFDIFGAVRALQEFAEEGLPVRVFGFPAFFYFTLQHMLETGVSKLRLHPESMTFFGGGWKGHADKAISKLELYDLAEDLLGIPNANCRDGFGSVEHCIPYIECHNHNFHIPVYSRVLIRDVKTLEVLPDGQVGYLNFVSPYITSVPANNVVMGDLAIRYPATACSCSLNAPYFEIIGRAGVSKNKSCAVAAGELLKEFH